MPYRAEKKLSQNHALRDKMLTPLTLFITLTTQQDFIKKAQSLIDQCLKQRSKTTKFGVMP